MSTLAVYDCMLFFRAAARRRLARPLFDLVHHGRVTLCLGPDVLAEIRDVLTRPKLIAKYPALTKVAVDAFLAEHLRSATWVSDVQEHMSWLVTRMTASTSILQSRQALRMS